MTSHTSLKPCVFLDRDGTINRESGYLNHPERLELLPGAAEAIRRLNVAGVQTVLVSNQAGLARGYFSEEVLRETFARLERLLAHSGAHLDRIYYAPFHPSSKDPRWRDDPDQMRKPGLGMIRKAQSELPIDMTRSWMVGDRYSDVVFAHRATLPCILVKTGYGLGEITYQREKWAEEPDHITEDLGEAVDWILKQIVATCD
jgi:D-glycero-D-manno-heptose 1,7-bisphosphate phosphatase